MDNLLWDGLSMRERAAYIRDAVSRGIYDIDSIRLEYNEFKGGGWFSLHKKRWNLFLTSQGVSANDALRLSGFFAALDGLESAGGTSNAAIEHNNYGGMQRNGKNIHYNSIDDYMKDKWSMMNRKFLPALNAQSIEEYGTILGNPDNVGKGYLYYVADGFNSRDPRNKEWVARLKAHMNNYIAGMQRYYGSPNLRKVIPLESLLTTYHVEQPDALRVDKPIITELIFPLLGPVTATSNVSDDDIYYEKTLPEVVVTPERKLYIRPDQMLAQMNEMVTPYTPVLYSTLRSPSVTDRLALINSNRVTLLLKDLEDSIIRNNLLGIQNPDKLRRDAEDLGFYRNMSALGDNKFGGGGILSLIPMPMILPRNTEGGKKQRKVLQFLPVVGTVVNTEEAIHNPTKYNIGRAGISAASDLFGLSLWRGAKAGALLVKGGLPTTKEVIRDVTSPWTRDEVRDVFRTGFGYGLPLMDTELDILENTKAEGGPIEYMHQRFPVTELLDIHPLFDSGFTPRDNGDFGDIEYMLARYDNLPYYNNYSKPDSLKGKSVIVYNDRLGEGTNEAIALDALSHGLRELDNIWRELYIPTLLSAFREDANYFADLEGIPLEYRQEYIDGFIDGKIRDMIVKDSLRKLLNYLPKLSLILEYRSMTPELLNALTEAYSYIFPTLLDEIVVNGKRR